MDDIPHLGSDYEAINLTGNLNSQLITVEKKKTYNSRYRSSDMLVKDRSGRNQNFFKKGTRYIF